MSFLGGSDSKESSCNVEDLDSIPRSGRFPGEGNGNALQYSCLGNSMDRGAWWVIVHGVVKSRALYGESNMETYITICKIGSQWEFAVCSGDSNRGSVST